MHPDSAGEFLVYHSLDNYSTSVILFAHKRLADFYNNMFCGEYLINIMKSFYASSQDKGPGNDVKRQYFFVMHCIRSVLLLELESECLRTSLTNTSSTKFLAAQSVAS